MPATHCRNMPATHCRIVCESGRVALCWALCCWCVRQHGSYCATLLLCYSATVWAMMACCYCVRHDLAAMLRSMLLLARAAGFYIPATHSRNGCNWPYRLVQLTLQLSWPARKLLSGSLLGMMLLVVRGGGCTRLLRAMLSCLMSSGVTHCNTLGLLILNWSCGLWSCGVWSCGVWCK